MDGRPSLSEWIWEGEGFPAGAMVPGQRGEGRETQPGDKLGSSPVAAGAEQAIHLRSRGGKFLIQMRRGHGRMAAPFFRCPGSKGRQLRRGNLGDGAGALWRIGGDGFRYGAACLRDGGIQEGISAPLGGGMPIQREPFAGKEKAAGCLGLKPALFLLTAGCVIIIPV